MASTSITKDLTDKFKGGGVGLGSQWGKAIMTEKTLHPEGRLGGLSRKLEGHGIHPREAKNEQEVEPGYKASKPPQLQ